MTITAPHCIRSINTQIAASSDALYFINFFITFNEKAIAHNNIPKDMTVNSINTVVSKLLLYYFIIICFTVSSHIFSLSLFQYSIAWLKMAKSFSSTSLLLYLSKSSITGLRILSL